MITDKLVLIVDDDERNIFSMEALFMSLDINYVTASNGEEAIRVLNEEKVDLVLMDIMMPIMDGITAMGIIRKDERYTSLPIIALTAKAMKGDKEKCLEAGASDYCSKPIDMDILIDKMEALLAD